MAVAAGEKRALEKLQRRERSWNARIEELPSLEPGARAWFNFEGSGRKATIWVGLGLI